MTYIKKCNFLKKYPTATLCIKACDITCYKKNIKINIHGSNIQNIGIKSNFCPFKAVYKNLNFIQKLAFLYFITKLMINLTLTKLINKTFDIKINDSLL